MRFRWQLRIVSFVICLGLAAAEASAEKARSIAGVVRSETGQVLEGVEIVVSPGDQTVISDVDGEFDLSLSPGTYAVTAQASGLQLATREVAVDDRVPAEIEIILEAASTVLGEIDVIASYGIDRTEPIATGALSSEEVLSLPRLGNDLLRGIRAIPGVTANDATAQFNVRGGLYRDTTIRLDGLEIFEPYHLKDFANGVFSIVDPEVIGALDLIPGGFPVEYGDKMAGVLDMTSVDASPDFTGRLGASLSSMWAGASGSQGADDQTRWQFSARRGVIEFVAGEEEDEGNGERSSGPGPRYWDFLGKVEHAFSPRNTLSLNVLVSNDTFEQEELERDDYGDLESDTIDSSYDNSYLWLNHLGTVGDSMFVNTTISAGRVTDDRNATEVGVGAAASIRDFREMDIVTFGQDWKAQLSDRHYLKWGAEARSYDAAYDYLNGYAFDGVFGEIGLTRFDDSFSSESFAAYFADRFRIGDSLVVEVGARYDRQTLTDEDQLSPRINLVYDLGGAGAVRASFGQYFQSHRPNELQVEDGETDFFPAERADTLMLGWERSRGAYNFRVDAYQREIASPRPYYDNIFEATTPNPETTRDRILVEPESSTARGLELFASRRGPQRLDWWGSYTWSEVTDRIDGRDVPRSYDQTHALTLSATYRFGPKWTLTGVFNYHTGWPTTSISGRAVEGPDGALEIEPVLGDLRAERIDDYHRLDLRLSRFVEFRNGNSLELFLDVQNVYDQDNVAGFLVDERNFTLLPSGEVLYVPVVEEWLPVVPTVGVAFRF